MTRSDLTLFVLFGVAWLCFLSLVMPDRVAPADNLLRDVRQEPHPISPWRR